MDCIFGIVYSLWRGELQMTTLSSSRLTYDLKGFIVGRIYDKYGPRWLMAFGTFMHVFGLMMASLSTKYYQIILSQGICSPIGICCLFTPGAYSMPAVLSAS